MSVPVPERTLLLFNVREWSEASRVARQEYVAAVKTAREAGMTHLEIAMSAGVSKDAIRMLLKRSS